MGDLALWRDELVASSHEANEANEAKSHELGESAVQFAAARLSSLELTASALKTFCEAP